MIRASRVEGDQAAPDGGSCAAMAATGDCAQAPDCAQAMQLELAYLKTADGKATVKVRGELDIATADQAYAYLRDVVDSQDGPITINLAELTFCDAAGLGVLARIAGHARRAGHSLKLTAARPSLLRIMRITGMDEAFPEVRNPAFGIIAWPRQAAVSPG
jgi:anti-anti-sigma factor